MERYNEYNDSGVYFIPDIPNSWQVLKAKYLFKQEKREVCPEDEIVTCFRDGQVTLRKNRRTEGFTNSMKEIGYQGVRKGDLVIHNMDAFAGAIGVSDSDGKGTPVYACCTPKRNDINQYYYCYLLRYLARNGFILSLAKGIRERSTDFRFNDFKELYLPVPSKEEQDAIVSYIDLQSTKIDEAIAQQQKMIDLLNERKQIIINNAVTKGLNPDAPMKDSGVDWIGEIPEHWEVRKLKHIAKLKSGDTISSDSFTEDGFPVYGGNGFRGYTNRFTNDGEYVLIGRQGALCGNVNYATGKFFASEHAVVVYPYDHENVAWLGEVIRASNLNQYSQSAAQPGLAVSVIENIAYPYPPEKERTAIAEYLAQQMNAINAALHNIERQISLLQERKQIIINDVVTGKVKVL